MSSLSLASIGKSGGFTLNPRFAVAGAGVPTPVNEDGDALLDAFERGYAEGVSAARNEFDQRERERDAAAERIEMAFARMDAQTAADMRERLRQTVLALCEEAVLPLALDLDGLTVRIDQAVGMLQRAQDDRRVLLNPQDYDLIRERLPTDLIAAPDPSVERGALRIETPDGGIEDGPREWRRALAEAFREC